MGGRVATWLLSGVLALVSHGQAQEAYVTVTYVANEGVLLAHGDTQVLIDGLHRPYKPAYAVLPPSERERLETAAPPYDQIDVVLVSHVHRDHFHAEAVGRHLRHNAGATLLASQQVADSLAGALGGFDGIRARVREVTPAMYRADTFAVGGAEVVVLRLRHTNERFRWVQNLGHVVTLGGQKLLHLGDAALSTENLQPLALDQAGIDVALLPVWFLLSEEGRRVVREHIRPRHVVALHVSPGEEAAVARRVRAFFPEAVVFTALLETTTF